MSLFQTASSNTGSTTPYEDLEAYEVYSTILPLEWPMRDARVKFLVIRTETKAYEMCLKPDKDWEEKVGPAIADYVGLNAKPLLLQRNIKLDIPYQLITDGELKSIVQRVGWEGLYQQLEYSRGWMELSAVGFNKDKTVAVVYVGHHCGGLCGGDRFHVLEKRDGRWVELRWQGSSCSWAA